MDVDSEGADTPRGSVHSHEYYAPYHQMEVDDMAGKPEHGGSSAPTRSGPGGVGVIHVGSNSSKHEELDDRALFASRHDVF